MCAAARCYRKSRQSAEWLGCRARRLAAAHGNASAEAALGSLYDTGRGVEHDPVAAFGYVSRAGAGTDVRPQRQ